MVLPKTFRKKWFFRKVLPEHSKVIQKNPSSENFPKELLLFRKPSGRSVLSDDLWLFPEESFFRKVSGTPYSRSSGRSRHGSSGRRHRNLLSPFFSASSTLRFHYPTLNATTKLHNKSNAKLGTPTSKANSKWFEEKKKHSGLAEKKKGALVSRKKKRSSRQEVSASRRRGAFLNFYLKGKMTHSLKLLGAPAILLGAPSISHCVLVKLHLLLSVARCTQHSKKMTKLPLLGFPLTNQVDLEVSSGST